VREDPIGLVELSLERRTAVTGPSACAVSRGSGNCAVGGDAPNKVIIHFTDVERSIGATNQAVGIGELRALGGGAVDGPAVDA
jgi:hypothetical protein